MIQFDSRKVKKGDVFVAIKGLTVDGHDYIDKAIKNGVKTVYGESDVKNKKYIRVSNSRNKLGELCSEFYDNPSSKLKVVGVTGTKGKTTTCHLIHHILTENGKKTGLISTISVEGFHTTAPDIITLNKYLFDMVKNGFEYVVLEVSSHGIDQGRIAGIKFDISVLTNIHPEHLDYHKTFKEYKRIKMMFVNSAQFRVFSPKETKLKILEGDFNNLNAETAIEVTKELGISKHDAINALKIFKLPEGRLEDIKNTKGIRILVDFAHTPDSLKAVLSHLKKSAKGKLVTIFGCAGERDFLKRPKMGKIASKFSDMVILTAEDPRSENVIDIINQIKIGVPKKFKKLYEIIDRKEAIRFAIRNAKIGDIVAVLGKGHEKTMNLDGINEIPWSDQSVIKEVLRNK